MATKDDFLFLKDSKNQQLSFSNDQSNNVSHQFTNLNLNQNNHHHQSSDLTSGQSHSNSIHNNRAQFDSNNGVEQHHGSTFSKSSSANLKSNTLQNKIEEEEEKKSKKKYENPSTNKSTLSLHIAAYENSVEVGDTDTAASSTTEKDDSLMKKKSGNGFLKKFKNVKQVFASPSSSVVMNPFEIPRQRPKDDEPTKPEIAQFKSSQRMYNPYEGGAHERGRGEIPAAAAPEANNLLDEIEADSELLNAEPVPSSSAFNSGEHSQERMDSLPDSDEENALNDETFGGGGDDEEEIPEDLSRFAELALKLEDIEDEHFRSSKSSRDNNKPSSSSTKVAATAKRPNDFGNQQWAGINSPITDDYQERAYKSHQDAVRATQSLWGQPSPINITSSSTIDSPRRDSTNFISSSGYNRAPSPPKSNTTATAHVLRSIPGGALTLDEIEHEQLMRTGAVHLGSSFPLTPGDKRTSINAPQPADSGIHVANVQPHSYLPHQQQFPSDWVHPPLPHSETVNQKKMFVTAEELESRLMEELQEKKAHQQQQHQRQENKPAENEQHSGMMPFGGQPPPPGAMYPPPGMAGAPGKMPPMNPMQIAQMQQYFQYQQAAMAAAIASGATPPPNIMPPGFPPLMSQYGPPNPAMFAAMMATRMQFPPPHGVPPPHPQSMMGLPPPSGFGLPQMNPQQQQQRSQTGTPNNLPPFQHPGWPLTSSPMMMNNRVSGCASPSNQSTTSRRTRKEGMPSMRTITDFACDPYAGFMSKKEREWLIKIQLIQCLGTGDKYADDYYYTCWKKNNTLEKRPDSWKQPKIKSKYYNLEETYPSVYNPPSFSGVLGKPTNATTSFPRQVLDIHPADDDVESIVGGSTTREVNKRKLRTILLSIENGYMWQLECDDLLRKVPTVSADEAGTMLNEIHAKLNAIYHTTMDETHIPTTMVITKGRRLCIRILGLATSPLKAQIISNVFNTLRKYARKVSISPNSDFIQATLKVLLEIKENDLKEFFDKTDAERFQDTLVYSSFSQNLFTALLIACAKREIHLEAFVPGSTIIKFLQSDRKMYNGLGGTYSEIFVPDDLSLLKTWLQKSLLCTSGNVAGCFLVCLREKDY